MPVIISGPYPSVQEVMDEARAIVADTYAGATNTPGEGRVLTNDAPFTLPYLNSAIRKLQRKLANNGQTTFIKDNVILTPITPVLTVDPAVQTFISYTGYFDGTNMNPDVVLPPDLLEPMELWERITGSNAPFVPMSQPPGGLPSAAQYNYLCQWEWRTDQINFIGSVNTEDIRLRYEANILQEIQNPDSPENPFDEVTIGTIDCQDALAYEVAYMFASSRGSGAPPNLKADRNEAIDQMITRFVRRSHAVAYERPPYNSGSGGQLYPGINQGNFS